MNDVSVVSKSVLVSLLVAGCSNNGFLVRMFPEFYPPKMYAWNSVDDAEKHFENLFEDDDEARKKEVETYYLYYNRKGLENGDITPLDYTNSIISNNYGKKALYIFDKEYVISGNGFYVDHNAPLKEKIEAGKKYSNYFRALTLDRMSEEGNYIGKQLEFGYVASIIPYTGEYSTGHSTGPCNSGKRGNCHTSVTPKLISTNKNIMKEINGDVVAGELPKYYCKKEYQKAMNEVIKNKHGNKYLFEKKVLENFYKLYKEKKIPYDMFEAFVRQSIGEKFKIILSGVSNEYIAKNKKLPAIGSIKCKKLNEFLMNYYALNALDMLTEKKYGLVECSRMYKTFNEYEAELIKKYPAIKNVENMKKEEFSVVVK